MNNPTKMHNSIARTACEVSGKNAYDPIVGITEMVELNNQKTGI